ncbi:aminoglycoside phosphotransferase (APT) family kinase protein [Actinocorallia herbida]|uniref:Aminoglycoside phosphotransferase (APT) family kinase protein n=1 Tax=Actinocorallia herbida TaxID=58109 RepID=A0A3N1CTY6_9ACTN|nr:phosphotransferase family protein [Actinocorallia herbida]ROO84766.1 aminoglycoside phosphotransferase (APT) family kinase protein [Actinocorallia herbida]
MSEKPTLDLAALNAWPGLAGLPGSGPVEEAVRLRGGAQNLLFTIRRADGTELVLRRPGRHLREGASAAFTRESRVLTALAGTGVPHPRLYASHPDDDVIGAPFSVLEKIEGFTPKGELPGRYGTDPSWRRASALALVEGAAKLASLDPYAIGLGDLSKTDNWLERQTARYLKMLQGYRDTEEYRATESPHVVPVSAWLEANRPPDFRIGIVHGDLQFANVMFTHETPGLAAIVDWEMAGLGDPLLDLAWILTAWREKGDPPGSDPYLSPWDGMPSRAELVDHYASLTGRDTTHFRWFQVLACFRLAALLEGTYVRALTGQLDRAMGEGIHDYASWLWQKAAQEIST